MITEVTLKFFSLYQCRVISHDLTTTPAAEKQRALNAMADHAIAGRLRLMSERYALDDIAEAWAELTRGAHRKLMIAL